MSLQSFVENMTIQQWLFLGLIGVMIQIIFGFVWLALFIIRQDIVAGVVSMIFTMSAVYQTLYIKSKIPTKEEPQ